MENTPILNFEFMPAQTHLIDIEIVSDSFTLVVPSIQYSHNPQVKTLYMDIFLPLSETEILNSLVQNIHSVIIQSESPANSISFNYLSNLLLNNMTCRLLDETCENIYYVFACNYQQTRNLMLASYKIASIYTYDINVLSFQKNLIESRIKEIKFKTNTNCILENYKKSIREWNEYSRQQESQLKGLNREIQDNWQVEEETDTSYGFGECILCCDRMKNIIFLPCGHVISCEECSVKKLKIPLNKKILRKSSKYACPLCKGQIVRAQRLLR